MPPHLLEQIVSPSQASPSATPASSLGQRSEQQLPLSPPGPTGLRPFQTPPEPEGTSKALWGVVAAGMVLIVAAALVVFTQLR